MANNYDNPNELAGALRRNANRREKLKKEGYVQLAFWTRPEIADAMRNIAAQERSGDLDMQPILDALAPLRSDLKIENK